MPVAIAPIPAHTAFPLVRQRLPGQPDECSDRSHDGSGRENRRSPIRNTARIASPESRSNKSFKSGSEIHKAVSLEIEGRLRKNKSGLRGEFISIPGRDTSGRIGLGAGGCAGERGFRTVYSSKETAERQVLPLPARSVPPREGFHGGLHNSRRVENSPPARGPPCHLLSRRASAGAGSTFTLNARPGRGVEPANKKTRYRFLASAYKENQVSFPDRVQALIVRATQQGINLLAELLGVGGGFVCFKRLAVLPRPRPE